MKIKVIAMLMVAGFALLLQSCASTRPEKPELAAIASSDQKVGFEKTLISSKKHSVFLSPYTELDVAEDKTLFMLGVQNNGDTSFDIGYDDITVDFQDSGTTLPASRMRIQTYEDFMDDLIEEQSTTERVYIRDGIRDAQREIESSARYQGDSDASSYAEFLENLSENMKPVVNEVLDELVHDIEIMRDNDRLLREAMPEIVMTPRTVMPGGAYSGIVVCDTRNLDEKMEGRFQVAVLVDGERHVFTFDRVLNK